MLEVSISVHSWIVYLAVFLVILPYLGKPLGTLRCLRKQRKAQRIAHESLNNHRAKVAAAKLKAMEIFK